MKLNRVGIAFFLAAFVCGARTFGVPIYVDLGQGSAMADAPSNYNQIAAAGTRSGLVDTNGLATAVSFTLERHSDYGDGSTGFGSSDYSNVAKLIPAIDPAAQKDSIYINNAGKGAGITMGFKMTFSGLTEATYDIAVLPTYSTCDAVWKIEVGVGDPDVITHPANDLSTVAQWTDVAPVDGVITITGYGLSDSNWDGVYASFVALGMNFELAPDMPTIPYSKGRIALSSDGNMHDDDDWGGAAASLLMLAAQGVQDKVSLYTYNDHVWGSENSDMDEMEKSVIETGSKLAFGSTQFLSAVSDPEAAYNAMRDEILASTAENPLTIVAAGPMQVTGTGLERAKAIDTSCLDHVRVISHAKWNNEHSDNPDGSEPSHSGWTWSEMEAEFAADGTVFDYIENQNNYESAEIGFATTNAGENKSQLWTPWEFMEDYSAHADADVNVAIQHVYDRIQAVGRPDLSDSGMVYYLFTGNDQGGPAGFKEMLDNGFVDGLSASLYVSGGSDQFVVRPANSVLLDGAVSGPVSSIAWTQESGPNTAALSGATTEDLRVGGLITGTYVFKITVVGNDRSVKTDSVTVEVSKDPILYEDDNGLVIMEAENTVSPYDLWELRTAYQTHTGDGYLYFTGNSPVTGTVKSPLIYDFKINKSGLYYLHLHASKKSQMVDGKWRSDVANDCFVKVTGDYTAHPEAADVHLAPALYKDLCKDTKFYGGNQEAFGWYPGNSSGAQLDPGGEANKRIAVYNFEAGETYRFTLSGRSRDYGVDRIVFRHAEVSTSRAFTLSSPETISDDTPPAAELKFTNGDFEAQPLGENANARSITDWYEYSVGTAWDDFLYSSTNYLSRDGNVLVMGKTTSFAYQSLGTIDETMTGVQISGTALKRNGYYWEPVKIELFAGEFPQAADEVDLSGLISLGSYIVNPDGYESLGNWGSKDETDFTSRAFSFAYLPTGSEIWIRLSVMAEEAGHNGCLDDLSLTVLSATDLWGAYFLRHGLSGDKSADYDGDGQSDWGEYLTGGNPTNSASFGVRPSFDASSGRYSFSLVGDDAVRVHVLTNSTLVGGHWGTNASLNISSTDGVLSNYTENVDTSAEQMFIKLLVE